MKTEFHNIGDIKHCPSYKEKGKIRLILNQPERKEEDKKKI